MTNPLIKKSTNRSTNTLVKELKSILNEKTAVGYEIVTVAFGLNL